MVDKIYHTVIKISIHALREEGDETEMKGRYER